MTDKFAPPQVFIRRDTASEICDVVVLVRGQEMVLRCPSYSQALKWARLECKSYKITQPDIESLNGLDHDELPLFLRRPPETTESLGETSAGATADRGSANPDKQSTAPPLG